MGDVTVEEVGLDRLDELLAWREAVVREVFGVAPDADLGDLMERNRAYYERELGRGGHVACVAVLDGEVVGCGGVCFQTELPSPDNPSGLDAYLMNVYTVPARRGGHVGRAVVDWLVARARERGAGKVYLESSEAGKRLYREAGFVPLEDMFHLPVR